MSKWIVGILFLVFTVKLFAGTVWEVIDERLIISTIQNTTKENLSLEDVRHRLRSVQADRATAVLNEAAHQIAYNKTIADYDDEIGNYTAANVSLTPK